MKDAVDKEHQALSWLIRLRFGAIASEAVLIAAVDRTTIPLPVASLLVVLGFLLGSNVALLAFARRRARVSPAVLFVALAVDVAALTGMLSFTGGPLNPFTSLYLVYIALAAVVLDARYIWALVALSAAGYALLFLESTRPLEIAAADHVTHMRIHLKGMWLAFMVAALFIGYFVSRIQRALAEQREELERVRGQQARSEKLAALATLAAGAAHELSTPLSTIAVVAKELQRRLQALGDEAALDDAKLIRDEVARCRGVLDQLAADAGGSLGEQAESIAISALIARAAEGLRIEPRIDVDPAVAQRALAVPARATAVALRGLLKNAGDADPEGEVRVHVHPAGDELRIAIADRGAGMDAATLARVGEPFFTTKEPGRGMGLGVFVTRGVIEHLGGQLRYETSPAGTTAVVALPLRLLALAEEPVQHEGDREDSGDQHGDLRALHVSPARRA